MQLFHEYLTQEQGVNTYAAYGLYFRMYPRTTRPPKWTATFGQKLHLKFSDDSGHWFIFGRGTCSYHRFLEFITRTSCYRTTGKSLLPQGLTNVAVLKILKWLDKKIFRKKLTGLRWPLEVTLKKKQVKNLNQMLFPKKRDVVLEKMINNVTLVRHFHESWDFSTLWAH